MFDPDDRKVFIIPGGTDMRKAIDGLSILLEARTSEKAMSGSYFAFCSKTRRIVKILYWQRNGFCLWQKRLSKERFHWPENRAEVLQIQPRELRWLLDGINISKVKAHGEFQFTDLI